MRVKMSKPPPPAPTASAIGPCPTVIKIVGRPGTGSLPSTIAPPDHPSDEKNVMISNKRFFRPAEAWHAIGVLKPPVWTTKQGTNYIPWPKFGLYGKEIGKNIAHLTDLDKIKQLNQAHLTDKMEICNRATIDNAAKEQNYKTSC